MTAAKFIRVVSAYPVSVKALTYHEGKFLFLLKRRKDVHKIYYGLPGGLKEPGESLEDALRREVREEIGIDVKVLDLLTAYTYTHPTGRENVVLLYLALPASLDFNLSGEEDVEFVGIKWLSPEELDALWPEEYREIIQHAISKALSLLKSRTN